MDIKKGVDLASTIAAPGPSMAARAGSGVASWVSYIGAGETVQSIKDPGFILFVTAGLLHFFGFFFLNSSTKLWFGVTFLICSVLLILKGRGMLLLIIYYMWNSYFGGSFNASFFIFTATILFLYAIIFGKESISQEAAGAIPLLIFYLDIGLLSLLVVKFNLPLTQLMKNLIMMTPWWAFFGLFTTKKESSVISIFKYIAIMYIMVVIVMGATRGVGFETNIPGISDIEQARSDINLQIGAQNISPAKSAWNNFNCLISEPQNSKECILRKQAKMNCEKYKSNKEEYDECIDRILNPQKYKELETDVDRTVEDYIRFELKHPYLANRKEIDSFEEEINFGARIELDSPKYPINIESKCYFEYSDKNGTKKNITGIMKDNFVSQGGDGGVSVLQNKQYGPFDLLCYLPEQGKAQILQDSKKGDATMKIISVASNLQNTAELKQYFLNKEKLNVDIESYAKSKGTALKTESQVQSAILQIYPEISTTYPNRKVISKSLPGFVSPVIKITENYIIPYEPGQRVLMQLAIQNNDNGKVTKISQFKFGLPPGFVSQCAKQYDSEGNYILIGSIKYDKISRDKQLVLPTCFMQTQNLLQTIPIINNNPVAITFYANIVYDYQLEFSHSFRVVESAYSTPTIVGEIS